MSTAFGVVGGGILGIAVARELTLRFPGARVQVFEKEASLATHQTGHNSGVLHAGLYYPPGSLKAELCGRGRSLLREFIAERGLPYDECGKLVVAIHPAQLGRLDAVEESARANGVPGLRRVGRIGITDIEPAASGVAALHSPMTGITDFAAVTEALADDVRASGGEIATSTEVLDVRRRIGRIEVLARGLDPTGEAPAAGKVHRLDRLVVCAGLQADRLGRLADGQADPRIVPFRGEYLRVHAAKQALVRGLIYPVPDPAYPFLGVHFTRRVTGELDIGPNAIVALAREGYRRRDLAARDLAALTTAPGFWRLAGQHWRAGAHEMHGSLSVAAFMAEAQRYVPTIGAADVTRAGFGIRAQAVDRDGSLVDDFRLHHEDGITTVRNAPSPAATSSLAIAAHIVAALAPR